MEICHTMETDVREKTFLVVRNLCYRYYYLFWIHVGITRKSYINERCHQQSKDKGNFFSILACHGLACIWCLILIYIYPISHNLPQKFEFLGLFIIILLGRVPIFQASAHYERCKILYLKLWTEIGHPMKS